MPISQPSSPLSVDRDSAVAVFVVARQHLGERRQRVEAVAEAHNRVAGDDRARDHGRCHAGVRPQPGAALHGVSAEEAAAGRDDLRGLPRRRVEDRRRPGLGLLVPRHPPLHRARRQGQRDDLGPLELVEHQNQRRGGDDRRRGGALAVGERAHRLLPAHCAGRVVGHDAEVAEEDVDVLAVRDRGRRGGLVQAVRVFMARRCFLPLPQQTSGLSVEALGVEHTRVVRRQEDVSPAQHGRRLARPDRRAPFQVARRAELDRIAGVRHDPGAVGAAEPRPVLRRRGRHGGKQDEQDDRRGNPSPRGSRHGRSDLLYVNSHKLTR